MPNPIIISGAKPTGALNVGGYLGAVKNWVTLQESGKYRSYIFIPDLHSLNTGIAANDLREQTLIIAAELLAAGIDPEKSCLFVQSHVMEHTELCWILANSTPVAELYRMTQFKDKSQKQEQNINAGLLNYPILMAADILVYKATQIPVGQDQIQHVELTRDIARWFNKRYGNYFPEPQHLLTTVPKVMGLLEPTKKMSKTDGRDNVIELADEPEVIAKKLKRAVTATEGGGQAPGVANLIMLLQQFGSAEVYQQFSQAEKDKIIRYGDLKQALAEAISNYFADFRKRRVALLADPEKIHKILATGAEQARAVAGQTMQEVRKLVGIR